MGAFSNAMAVGAVKDVQTNIEIDLADGNHDLEIDGSGNSVSVGNGNQNIKVVGSNTNVKTGDGNSKIVHYGSNSSISTGNGNQDITSIGDNKQITTGDGDDDVTFIGDNVLYFILSNNHETVLFYEYSINDKTNTFIAEGDYNNTILMNINNLYLYNDNNKLYSYDGVSNNEIYEAESKISEISYLNPNEIIIIPDTYTNDDCSLASVKVGILNIQTKKISIKTINGCLDTKIINDVIFAK